MPNYDEKAVVMTELKREYVGPETSTLTPTEEDFRWVTVRELRFEGKEAEVIITQTDQAKAFMEMLKETVE